MQAPIAAVLIISPIPFVHDHEGNRKRVRQIVEFYEQSGFAVHFLFIEHASGSIPQMKNEISGTLTVLADEKSNKFYRRWIIQSRLAKAAKLYWLCNFWIDEWYFDKIGKAARKIVAAEKISIVVCEYIFYSKALVGLDNVVKIIDTHDVFGDRYKIFTKIGKRPQWFSTTKKGEKKALERADLVLAIQEYDADYFKKSVKVEVMTLHYIPPSIVRVAEERVPGPIRILFVGSNQDVNRAAVDYLLSSVVPALIDSKVNFCIHIAGTICNYLQLHNNNKWLVLHGTVESLTELYQNVDVVVNPSTSGTGLPIKVMEALSHGLIVVGSSSGLRGVPLGTELSSILLCETPSDWAASIAKIETMIFEGANMRVKVKADYEKLLELSSQEKKRVLDWSYKKMSS